MRGDNGLELVEVFFESRIMKKGGIQMKKLVLFSVVIGLVMGMAAMPASSHAKGPIKIGFIAPTPLP
jgi:hypothetical protein